MTIADYRHTVSETFRLRNSLRSVFLNYRFYREANVSREDLLELLSSLMKGAVLNISQSYVKQIEKSLHLDQLTAANLTFFMQNVSD